MHSKMLEAIKERDQALIKKFCVEGNYMADGSKTITYVCRMVDASEILEFMHQWDAVFLQIDAV